MNQDTTFASQTSHEESLRQQAEEFYAHQTPIWRKALDRSLKRLTKELTQSDQRYTLKYRIKNFTSFYRKYLKRHEQEPNLPFVAITDFVGIRIIVPFIEQLTEIEDQLQKVFHILEVEHKGMEHNFREFGYESIHMLLQLPAEDEGETVEIQIRTILQEAWAEVEHELVYKSDFKPYNEPLKRKLAAINANLTISDTLIQELREYQKSLEHKIQARRHSFIEKVQESTDRDDQANLDILEDGTMMDSEGHHFFPPNEISQTSLETGQGPHRKKINELLLQSLNAHNRENFDQAIDLYSRLLKINPENYIKGVIYIHRGMALFSRSKYQEAIHDFSQAYEVDASNLRTIYYRGLSYQVLKQYPDALNDFNLCIQKDPFYFDALYSRAQIYYHLQDYAQAITECESILRLYPEAQKVKKFLQLLRAKLMG